MHPGHSSGLHPSGGNADQREGAPRGSFRAAVLWSPVHADVWISGYRTGGRSDIQLVGTDQRASDPADDSA